MSIPCSPEDQVFLAEVARLEAGGLQKKEIAQRLGVAPGTVTYRLHRLGYRSYTRTVDARTGAPLSDLFSGDGLTAGDAPAEAPE